MYDNRISDNQDCTSFCCLQHLISNFFLKIWCILLLGPTVRIMSGFLILKATLYSSPNIVWVIKSRRLRWAGHVARMEEERGVHKVLVGKPEGKRPVGTPRRRWEDNIKMDLQEVGRGCGDWMELAKDRDRWRALVSTGMNFRVP